jgi:hypothetical protein
MDLSIALIAIVTIAAFVVPILLVSRAKKLRDKRFLQLLIEMARKTNNTISEYENFNNTAIGIDKNAFRLFFTRKTNAGDGAQLIDLKEVLRCRVVNTSNSVSRKENSYTVIEKIQLAFTYRDKNKPDTTMEFYNNDHDSLTISGELQIAEKWARIINENIAKIPSKK